MVARSFPALRASASTAPEPLVREAQLLLLALLADAMPAVLVAVSIRRRSRSEGRAVVEIQANVPTRALVLVEDWRRPARAQPLLERELTLVGPQRVRIDVLDDHWRPTVKPRCRRSLRARRSARLSIAFVKASGKLGAAPWRSRTPRHRAGGSSRSLRAIAPRSASPSSRASTAAGPLAINSTPAFGLRPAPARACGGANRAGPVPSHAITRMTRSKRGSARARVARQPPDFPQLRAYQHYQRAVLDLAVRIDRSVPPNERVAR